VLVNSPNRIVELLTTTPTPTVSSPASLHYESSGSAFVLQSSKKAASSLNKTPDLGRPRSEPILLSLPSQSSCMNKSESNNNVGGGGGGENGGGGGENGGIGKWDTRSLKDNNFSFHLSRNSSSSRGLHVSHNDHEEGRGVTRSCSDELDMRIIKTVTQEKNRDGRKNEEEKKMLLSEVNDDENVEEEEEVNFLM
jgi:hypothetical protein